MKRKRRKRTAAPIIRQHERLPITVADITTPQLQQLMLEASNELAHRSGHATQPNVMGVNLDGVAGVFFTSEIGVEIRSTDLVKWLIQHGDARGFYEP